MSYHIEFLNDDWTRALVTEKRWFKPPRVTEVERRYYGVGDSLWYHVGTDIVVEGAFAYEDIVGIPRHDGLQRRLHDARDAEMRRRQARLAAVAQTTLDVKRQAAWREVETLPKATAKSSKG